MLTDAGWREWVWRRWPELLGCAVFLAGLWAQPAALVGVFYDDGIYVVLARALAEGEGYRNIHLPGAPPGVHFPILYPLVLSFLWRLWPAFPANVALFQLLDCAALGFAAWAVARHARRLDLPRAAQYVALPAGFFAFPLLTIVGVRFSEPLFLALWAAAVLAAERDRWSDRGALGAGALAGLAALTRTVGVAVIGAVVVAVWLRGERRRAVLAAAAALVLQVPWLLWLWSQRGAIDPRLAANYGTYLDAAGQAGAVETLAGVNLAVLGPLLRLSLPSAPAVLWYAMALLLLGALGWGVAWAWRRVPLLLLSLAGYLAMVAVWPFAPDRFVWIVVPWSALLVGAGVWRMWRRGRVARAAAVLVALVVAAGYLPREASSVTSRRFARTAEGISVPFARWLLPAVAQETPRDAVLAVSDEALVFLYTGRRAVMNFPFRWKRRSWEAYSIEETREFYCAYGVTHVALTSRDAEAAPVVAELSGGVDPALRTLFRVTSGPSLHELTCAD